MSVLLHHPPPPPPTASTSLSTSDTLTALARQTAHLQTQLQTLLDAQSHGLSAGLGRAPSSSSPSQHRLASPSPSPSSPTPRASSTSSSRTRNRNPSSPSRRSRPQQPRPSLSAARAGIHTTLVALAHAKAGEHAALCARLEGCSSFLKNASRLARKRAALEARIVALEQGEDGDEEEEEEEQQDEDGGNEEEEEEEGGELGRRRLGNGDRDGGNGAGSLVGGGRQLQLLAKEEDQLVQDVRVLEEELAVKKARLAHVRRRREEGASRLEARLSSWRAALSEVERRVQEEVLDGRALPDGLGENVRGAKGKGRMGEESVWALPKARRTLEMVKDGVVEQVRELEGRIGDAEEEGEACVEGAGVWKGVAGTVAKVEAALKKELGRMNGATRLRRQSSNTRGSDASGTTTDDKTAEEGMQGVLQQMQDATTELERAYREAEGRGWKLLICAIGAELGALSEGRDMLEKAFGMSQVTLDGLQLAENDTQKTVNGTGDLDKTREGSGNGSNLVNVGSEEDDGPSEDLLFSRAD